MELILRAYFLCAAGDSLSARDERAKVSSWQKTAEHESYVSVRCDVNSVVEVTGLDSRVSFYTAFLFFYRTYKAAALCTELLCISEENKEVSNI